METRRPLGERRFCSGRRRRVLLAATALSFGVECLSTGGRVARAVESAAPNQAGALAAPVAPQVPLAPGLPQVLSSVIGEGDVSEIGDQRIDAALARELYAPRAFAPLWVQGRDADDRIRDVVEVLRRAPEHGLDPQRYHVRAIDDRLGATARGDRERAELEALVSDAVMRYGAHVASGAYRPLRPTKEIELVPVEQDTARTALEASAAPDVRAYLESLPPSDSEYRELRQALARYREIVAKGGWPTVAPQGAKLSPGERSADIAAIRARLAASGEADGASHAPSVYDPELVVAVKAFQARHGLAADGVIGARTRQALATPAEERLRQLELALERSRWRPRDLGSRYVLVNIPDQRLEVRGATGDVELEMPVVVGKPSWATPEFSASMTDVVFNPPWNVPPKIARDEVLPRARRDESYFAREGISVRSGVVLASAPTDSVSDASPGEAPPPRVVRGPVRLRQAPGPRNPLGRVKFNIANGFGVYLHDTPNKGPFTASDRRLSHGCVRVGNAKALAAAVTRDMPEWDDERRARMAKDWKTRSVRLPESVPVHIVYATAWVDDAGAVQFREDVYGRDQALLARWEKPRSARRPAPAAGSSNATAATGAATAAAEAPEGAAAKSEHPAPSAPADEAPSP